MPAVTCLTSRSMPAASFETNSVSKPESESPKATSRRSLETSTPATRFIIRVSVQVRETVIWRAAQPCRFGLGRTGPRQLFELVTSKRTRCPMLNHGFQNLGQNGLPHHFRTEV